MDEVLISYRAKNYPKNCTNCPKKNLGNLLGINKNKKHDSNTDILIPNSDTIYYSRSTAKVIHNQFNKIIKIQKARKFDYLYQKTFQKIKRRHFNNDLPSINSMASSSNNIIKYIRRHVLLTGDDYPYSLTDKDCYRNKLYEKEIASPLKRKKCILEEIDNENYMMKIKSMFNEEIINKEKLDFNDKKLYLKKINELKKQISSFKSDKEIILTKKYEGNINYNKYILGELSIKSIGIKIHNIAKNLEKILYLPYSIIPFYLSVSQNIFNYFIYKILILFENSQKLTDNFSKISIDEFQILKNLNDFASCYEIFNNYSYLFDDYKISENSYYYFCYDEIFILTIIPPNIELTKNDGKIKINKFASKGLLLELFGNNHKYWDLMCFCYLYSFQIFRKLQLSSIKRYSDKIINLNIDQEIKGNTKNGELIKQNDKKLHFFTCNKTNDGEYCCLFLTLCLFSISEFYLDCQEKKSFLTLEESKLILNLQLKNNNLFNILYKCSKVKELNKGIKLNLALLNTIKNAQLNNYFKNNLPNNNRRKSIIDKKYQYTDKLKIQLNSPYIYLYKLDKMYQSIKDKIIEIEPKILEKMDELEFLEWMNLLSKTVVKDYNVYSEMQEDSPNFNRYKVTKTNSFRKKRSKSIIKPISEKAIIGYASPKKRVGRMSTINQDKNGFNFIINFK